MNRIHSLESLRGLLALWVVIGHTIRHSGYGPKDLGPFGLLVNPSLAVDVFIILSGFVIFFLLDQRRTSYVEFIVRRWFRLAPVFLFVLFVAALTLSWQTEQITSFPWKNGAVLNDLTIHLDAGRHFAEQLFVHVLMLHGLLADSVLPNSQYGFVGQAWSISVEWQFYLLAPLIFSLVVKQAWHKLAIFILAICVVRALNYGGEGFAVNQAGYFIVGIVSYYIWKHSDRLNVPAEAIDVIAVIVAALVFMLMSRTVSLLIWILVLSSVVAEKRGLFSPTQKVVSVMLNHEWLQRLGKISYSVYMVHMLVYYAVTNLLFMLIPAMSQFSFAAMALPCVVLMTLVTSQLLYSFCEQPGINAGQRFSKLLLALRFKPLP